MTEFIETYRQHPALWKIKCKEYTNKNLKNVGLKELIEVFKKYNIEADKDFVTKKIQSMGGSFRKELKKVKTSQRSGTSAEDVYVPSLWYYDLLFFIKEEEMMAGSVSNLSSPHSVNTNDDESETQESQQAIIEETQGEADEIMATENHEIESASVVSTLIFEIIMMKTV